MSELDRVERVAWTIEEVVMEARNVQFSVRIFDSIALSPLLYALKPML